jgi:hypothetical protein
MAVNLSPVGGVAAQFFTNTGAVLTGGKLYTYAAGTTTPVTTYTSGSGGAVWTNPIVLNAAGRVPDSGEIWLVDGVSYKFVLKDSTDVLIATYDNITGINSNFINYTNQQQIITATAGQTVFTLTTMEYQPGTGSLSVFVDGVNQYGPGAQYAFTETNSTTVTFTSGLHVGASLKFTTSEINGSSYGTAFQISYTPPFTNSVGTNVGAKLAQVVNVKDFGAKGDGSTNDATAFTNAISYCAANNLCLYVPSVSSYYNIATNITVSCKFSAGNYRVFGGAGVISFNANTTEVVYSSWFNSDTPASTIFASGNVPNWVKLDTGVEHKIKDNAPAATTYQTRTFVSGAGFPSQAKGVGAYRIDVADSAAVLADPTKKGVLYGIVMTIDPVVARSNIPYDDATGLLIQNGGTQKATDAIYIGNGSPATVQWNAILSCDASSSVGISMNAYCETYGIDLAFGSYGYGAMRIPNASAFLARNGANNDDVPLFRLDSTNTLKFGSAGWPINLAPFTDNTQSMGIATNRWSVIYAGTGTINTSDATQKQDVADLTVAEQAVAKSIKGLIKTFRFKDAIAQKGDDARTHVGVMAQDVAAAFAEQGLDANKYGMFCADTYVDEDGAEQTVYGVRYEELLAFVISAL